MRERWDIGGGAYRLIRGIAWACLVLALTSCGSLPPDAVGYSSGKFHLYRASSSEAVEVPCPVSVGDYSVAPDGRFVVFSSVEDKHAGAGYLYRLDLHTGKLDRLTDTPFYYHDLERNERELYAVPQLSPNGRLVAFAVRAVAGNESDDLIGLRGPVGMFSLADGVPTTLANNVDIDGGGPLYVEAISWSPDGHRLLVLLENQSAVIAATGKGFRWIDGLLLGDAPSGEAYPVAWLDNSRLLFLFNADRLIQPDDLVDGELRVADLDTGRIRPAADALRVAPLPLQHASGAEFQRGLLLLQHGRQTTLFGADGKEVRAWKGEVVHLRGGQ